MLAGILVALLAYTLALVVANGVTASYVVVKPTSLGLILFASIGGLVGHLIG